MNIGRDLLHREVVTVDEHDGRCDRHVSGARSHIIKIRVSGTLDDEARFQPAIKSFTKELLKRLNE